MKFLMMVSMIALTSCGKFDGRDGDGNGRTGRYSASAADVVRCYEGQTQVERSHGNVGISALIKKDDTMEVIFEREGCKIVNNYNVDFDGSNLQISGVSSVSMPSGCQITASYPGLSTDTETITEDSDIATYSENYEIKSGDVELEATNLNSGDLECFYTLSQATTRFTGGL